MLNSFSPILLMRMLKPTIVDVSLPSRALVILSYTSETDSNTLYMMLLIILTYKSVLLCFNASFIMSAVILSCFLFETIDIV